MCMLCVEYEKQRITSREVMHAMKEIVAHDKTQITHLQELAKKILDNEVSEGAESDPDLDAEWERKNHGAD